MKLKAIYFLLFFFSIGTLVAQDIPKPSTPPRLVNDFANQLNATERNALEEKLVAYNDSTSTQVTVVIVPTTGDYPIADYAFQVGREWGVGQKGKNNGVVILWASSDRKVFIATGYGLEGAIPDAIAKRIVEQVIIPNFRNGMYYKGLSSGADYIIKYATGEFKAAPKSVTESDEIPWGLIIFFIIFFIIILNINKNKGGGRNGGRRVSSGPVFWPYTTYSGHGRSSGSWGGGDFGGGGFGGFGGGSFGGGGAGGSY